MYLIQKLDVKFFCVIFFLVNFFLFTIRFLFFDLIYFYALPFMSTLESFLRNKYTAIISTINPISPIKP